MHFNHIRGLIGYIAHGLFKCSERLPRPMGRLTINDVKQASDSIVKALEMKVSLEDNTTPRRQDNDRY